MISAPPKFKGANIGQRFFVSVGTVIPLAEICNELKAISANRINYI